MKELKKILQTYSPNYVMLGEEESSEESQNAKIEEMRVSLENLIKKEYKKILVVLVLYIIIIVLITFGVFLYRKSALNNLATIFTVTGLSPLSLIVTIRNFKQKINASVVLDMVKNLNKETLNSVLSVFMSSLK
jgi:hypothetical protein